MVPREGMTRGTFSARLHHVQGKSSTEAAPNSYMYANDLRASPNTAQYTCLYTETRVRVQQGLEGPLHLRSSESFSPVDTGHMHNHSVSTHTTKHNHKNLASYFQR